MLMCMCRAVPTSALVSAECISAVKAARDCSWSCFAVLYMGNRGASADDAILHAAQLVSCRPCACACSAQHLSPECLRCRSQPSPPQPSSPQAFPLQPSPPQLSPPQPSRRSRGSPRRRNLRRRSPHRRSPHRRCPHEYLSSFPMPVPMPV